MIDIHLDCDDVTDSTLCHAIWVLQATLNDARACLQTGDKAAAIEALSTLEIEAGHLADVRDILWAEADALAEYHREIAEDNQRQLAGDFPFVDEENAIYSI